MSNYHNMRALISSFSGQDRMITVPRIYIELVGEYPAAALLNQIVFWSDKSKRKDGFFYKTYKEWEEELALSEYQVRRCVKQLEEKGVVETKLKKANGSPTLHYKLDHKALEHWLLKELKNGNQRNSRMETKGTQESLTVDYNSRIQTVDSNSPAKAERIPYKEIIDYLNEQAGREFSHKSGGNKKLIRARWNEGYVLDDFKTVIDNKVTHANDPTHGFDKQYLRPNTLFRPSKFDEYLNEIVKKEKESLYDF